MKRLLTAVVANTAGEIFELDGYAAVGMAGDTLVPLVWDETMAMPFGGELMLMPGRSPVLYNIRRRKFEVLTENPVVAGEPVYPVAAFNSPGYLLLYISAYKENDGAEYLPLLASYKTIVLSGVIPAFPSIAVNAVLSFNNPEISPV